MSTLRLDFILHHNRLFNSGGLHGWSRSQCSGSIKQSKIKTAALPGGPKPTQRLHLSIGDTPRPSTVAVTIDGGA
jgi:hypothetical protein